MKKNMLIACLLLCAFSVQAAQKSRLRECSPTVLASIDLVIDEEAVYVPVTANGRNGLMKFSTAGAASHIRPEVLDELKLPTRTAHTKDGFGLELDGKVVTQMVSIDQLMIGSLRLLSKEWMVTPEILPPKEVAGQLVLGTLAMDRLWRFDFELDLANKKLALYSHDRCPGQPVWTGHHGQIPVVVAEHGNIYFPVELNGKKIEASFSTSSHTTYMSAEVARRLFGITENSPDVETAIDVAGESIALFRAAKLASADLTITDVRIALLATGDDCRLSAKGRPSGAVGFVGGVCYGVYPLALGRHEMENLRLYFATQEMVVYFTAAEATH